MTKKIEIQDLPLWKKLNFSDMPLAFHLDLTERCNLNCKHCYINHPANDLRSKSLELSVVEINSIADQAANMGTMWCLLSGGEPLLRSDFTDIYLSLKKRGFLINLFTNATLINEHHIDLFKNFPPRDLEVTVYGITKETYESVTRVSGSFNAFLRGLNLLLDNKIKVTLKAMVLRSNKQELFEMKRFCEERTSNQFRFDPMLHLRYDRDPLRNKEIIAERLDPQEIVALEMVDKKRFQDMLDSYDNLIFPEVVTYEDCLGIDNKSKSKECQRFGKLFRCGIGRNEYAISFDGHLCLCSTLRSPGLTYNLREGSLQDGLNFLRKKIFDMETESIEILKTCKSCKIVNLCMWCPAMAYLETGNLEGEVPYFCQVAHARAAALEKAEKERS